MLELPSPDVSFLRAIADHPRILDLPCKHCHRNATATALPATDGCVTSWRATYSCILYMYFKYYM